ncbi:MAG: hypothetical protein AUJ49_11900, partial [Desulfovibrionaceae bacterium CG1_02_65_16]
MLTELLTAVDIRTVLLALCLGNLATAALLRLYSGAPHGAPERLFGQSKLILGLGWLLLTLRGQIPDLASITLGDGLMSAGFWLEAGCIRGMDQRIRPLPHCWRAVAFFCLGSVLVYWLLPQTNLRITVYAFAMAALFQLSCLRLLRGGERPRSTLRTTLGLIYGALALAGAWRGIAALGENDMTLFASGVAASLVYLPLFLLMIAGSFGLLLLFKERDDRALARMATHDELTGAPNRRALLDMAGMLAARSRREARPLAVLMLDIDHFKQVNDTYGHIAGDAVLCDLARIIRANLRAYDIFGRYGGEEFVAVLPDAARADALGAAERIRAAVEASLPQALLPGDSSPRNAPDIRYTVSIGAAWGVPGAIRPGA